MEDILYTRGFREEGSSHDNTVWRDTGGGSGLWKGEKSLKYRGSNLWRVNKKWIQK